MGVGPGPPKLFGLTWPVTLATTSRRFQSTKRKGQLISLLGFSLSFGFAYSHRILGPGLSLFGRHVCSSRFTAGAAAFLATLCSHFAEPLEYLRRELLARHLDHGTLGTCVSNRGS